MYEHLVDPKTANAVDPAEAPFCKALGVDISFWEWMELPSNAPALHKFGAAMVGTTTINPPSAVLRSEYSVYKPLFHGR